MRTITKKFTIYKFNELSEQTQERAESEIYNIACNEFHVQRQDEIQENFKEQFAKIGIEIDSVDYDYNRNEFEIHRLKGLELDAETIDKIKTDFWKYSENEVNYIFDNIKANSEFYENGEIYNLCF